MCANSDALPLIIGDQPIDQSVNYNMSYCLFSFIFIFVQNFAWHANFQLSFLSIDVKQVQNFSRLCKMSGWPIPSLLFTFIIIIIFLTYSRFFISCSINVFIILYKARKVE
jgi:hypothetical protein